MSEVKSNRAWRLECEELRSRLVEAETALRIVAEQDWRYDELKARLAEVEARHQRVMAVIRLFCAKYTPDLLAEFDAVVTDSASHRENERE